MEVAMTTGASLRKSLDWHSINWKKAHQNVCRLQMRIVKALKEGNKRKVRALQLILTRSFSGRAIAVKRVTENRGKRTPGIDKVIWNSPEKKAQAVLDLHHKGYRPQPLKRIFIPKRDNRQRPLSIPVMKDRAMQALHLLALDPIAESTADSNSYAFRKSRSTADAIEQCYCVLAKRSSPQWIYEGDIRSCFDEISQGWILSNIPMDKTILRKWLKAGYCYQQVWYPTDTGSPQGAIISPAISNMTLDGLEKELKSKFAPTEWIARRNQVNLVRYADDFIITGKTKELLEQEVKPLVESFLKARALTLSPSKTKITHISDGFDFLGKNIRKYNGKFLTKPSTKNVKAFLAKIRGIINGNLHTSVSKLIIKLNPIIKGWAQYHRYSASKSTFAKVDSKIFWMLWSWAKRRHPKKSKNWIKKKYFHSTPTRNWVFQVPLLSQSKVKSYLTLNRAMDMPISRQIKIKGEANPYDPAWESYFEDRLRHQMVVNFRERKRLLRLWFDQEGICPICSQKITKDTDWNIHHILWRVVGGKDTLNNLVLLHPNCHRQVHSLGLSVSKPRPLKRASREA